MSTSEAHASEMPGGGVRAAGAVRGGTPIPVARGPRGLSTRLLRSELRLVFGRRRNQALLAALACVPVLIAVAIRLSEGYRKRATIQDEIRAVSRELARLEEN